MQITVEELKNYRKLTFSIRYWKSELRELQRKSLLKSPEITGMPRGSNTPDPTAERALAETKIMSRIERMVAEQEAESEKIMAWIQSINDPMIQTIMYARHIRGKSWTAVAHEIGGYNTAENIRQIHSRYLSQMSHE